MRGIAQQEIRPGVWAVRTERYRTEQVEETNMRTLVDGATDVQEGDPVEIIAAERPTDPPRSRFPDAIRTGDAAGVDPDAKYL